MFQESDLKSLQKSQSESGDDVTRGKKHSAASPRDELLRRRQNDSCVTFVVRQVWSSLNKTAFQSQSVKRSVTKVEGSVGAKKGRE